MVCRRKYFPWLCAGMDLDWRDNVLIRSEDFCKGFSFFLRQIQQEETCFRLTIHMWDLRRREEGEKGENFIRLDVGRVWLALIFFCSVQLLRLATFWGTLEIFSSMLLFVPICPGELALYLRLWMYKPISCSMSLSDNFVCAEPWIPRGGKCLTYSKHVLGKYPELG